MLKVKPTTAYLRQLKKLFKKHYSLEKYKIALTALATDDKAALKRLKDHQLTGNYASYRELHIGPDWLLIYERQDDVLVLVLVATGSHKDLLGK
ncbi:type II toxin-antitoxin system RelE/ParE family toxin [Lacticaseibacillus yichunensis]|uniref:Type II toxin-antitoxin system YafQ family toxin n=1 Tax=Lacticaseibacillus yichunensis TaxID=2486015 RepID=A0ABW4CMS0_9LACO|nr:type II toxin-antitoxin system YafQ family toxin [Lacticaseibacillus yichunensis]